MFISPAQAPELILDIFRAGLVPMLTSSPGIGKSSIAKQIAKKENLKVIDLRLAQSDPTDLNGFPAINEDHTRAGYVPMDTFPIEGDSIPEGYNGWLLLMDEFNSAPMSVQAAAYKIVLDKQVGKFNLHKHVVIMCAGNLDTDRAIVNRLSTAMQSRMIHLQLEVDHGAWIKWAMAEGIDYRVISWLNLTKDALHKFDPDHNDKTFPCPRTWEFVSKIIKPWDIVHKSKMPIIVGTVGEGMANEFMGFLALFDIIPTIAECIANPTSIELDIEPSFMYALSGMIYKNLVASNIDKLIQLINRMPIEFQIYTLNGAMSQDRSLTETPAGKKWIKENAQQLL